MTAIIISFIAGAVIGAVGLLIVLWNVKDGTSESIKESLEEYDKQVNDTIDGLTEQLKYEIRKNKLLNEQYDMHVGQLKQKIEELEKHEEN